MRKFLQETNDRQAGVQIFFTQIYTCVGNPLLKTSGLHFLATDDFVIRTALALAVTPQGKQSIDYIFTLTSSS